MNHSDSAVHFENSAPILRVASVVESVAFYVQALGFANAEWGDDNFTWLTRDNAAIYLCRQDQGRGEAWVWVGVSDVMLLHEQLQAKGVTVRLAPTNYPWALETHVEDLDGNVLRFGSEPLESLHFRAWVETGSVPQKWRKP